MRRLILSRVKASRQIGTIKIVVIRCYNWTQQYNHKAYGKRSQWKRRDLSRKN